MTDAEFNRRINALIGGLPITLVVSRLCVVCRAVVDDCGERGADALRLVTLESIVDADESDYDDIGWPLP